MIRVLEDKLRSDAFTEMSHFVADLKHNCIHSERPTLNALGGFLAQLSTLLTMPGRSLYDDFNCKALITALRWIPFSGHKISGVSGSRTGREAGWYKLLWLNENYYLWAAKEEHLHPVEIFAPHSHTDGKYLLTKLGAGGKLGMFDTF